MKGFPGGSDGKGSACNVGDLGWKDPLEKGMDTQSAILALESHLVFSHCLPYTNMPFLAF